MNNGFVQSLTPQQFEDFKYFLDSKVELYNRPEFIESDPVQIPHLFSDAEDIEISGFFASTFAWGQRKTIINKSKELMRLMENSPHSFIRSSDEKDLLRFDKFCHRTFNSTDTLFFLRSLRNIYLKHGGLEAVFEKGFALNQDTGAALAYFRDVFFEQDYPKRTLRHVPNILHGSSAKRLNMFLRWMVRNDNMGVDFGIWKNINPARLCIPLDLHSGAMARKLGLLLRKQNDWRAVVELTEQLQLLDPKDPVKYDFALFGMNINGDISEKWMNI